MVQKQAQLAEARRSLIADLVDRFGAWILPAYLILILAVQLPVWHPDMAGLYLAARFYAEGQMAMVYDAPPFFFGGSAASWISTLDALGSGQNYSAFPFVYPPIWVALFAPFAKITSIWVFSGVLLVIQAILFGLSVRLVWEAAGRVMPWPRYAAIATVILGLSASVAFAFYLNQPQLTLTFLSIWLIRLIQKQQQIAAGIVLGVMAALKLTPIVLIVVLLSLRQYRAALTCAFTTALLALLSLLVAGPDLHRHFLTALHMASDNNIFVQQTWSIKALLGYLMISDADIHGKADGFGALFVNPPLATWIAMALLAILVTLALWRVRHMPAFERAFNLSIALAIILALAGPLGWSHYYMAPLMALPVLLTRPITHRTAIVIAVAIFVSTPLMQMVGTNIFSWFTVLGSMGSMALCAWLFLKGSDTPLRPASP